MNMKTLTIRNHNTHDTALLLLRTMTGAVFAFHGAQKLFGLFGGHGLNGFAAYLGSLGIPFPLANAWLAASAEFLGGVALLAGVGVGFASVPLVVTMLVASFALRAGGFDAQKGGFEFPLTLAVVTASVGLLGAGRFTLLNALRRVKNAQEKCEPSVPQVSLP
jgi:putative oxidoreductase